MSKLILIPDRLQPPADIESEVFGRDVEIVVPTATHVSQISDDVWRRVEAVLAWHDLKFDASAIAKLTKCKILVRVGVGFDNVDLQAAGKQGIPVFNVPDYGTEDVADHALALMLSLSRGLPAFNRKAQLSNHFWHWEAAGKLRRLSGASLGIVGLGRIGTAVARRAQAFGLKVCFYDPYIADGYDKALKVTRFEDLGELLANCDIVSLHTPLTDETRNMADARFFHQMRQGAVFINTARGAIVDFDALTNALETTHVRAAGLDVLPLEPPDEGHPLIAAWRKAEDWIIDRLVITPHAAFYCEEAYAELRKKAAITAKRFLDGEFPRNCVNLDWLADSMSRRTSTSG